jgi:hypothetical protein
VLRAVAEQRCELVTVIGEAGLGKSRLLATLVELRPAAVCVAARPGLATALVVRRGSALAVAIYLGLVLALVATVSDSASIPSRVIFALRITSEARWTMLRPEARMASSIPGHSVSSWVS